MTRNQYQKNILLLGVSGAGKTCVGRALSFLMGFGHFDTDSFIEKKRKKSIRQIFEEDGEESFRNEEKNVFSFLHNIERHVISLGGGFLSQDQDVQKLEGMGIPIWLNPPAREIAERLLKNPELIASRPLLKSTLESNVQKEQLIKMIQAMGGQRESLFEKAALAINSQYATVEATASRIYKILLSDQSFRKAFWGR